jgi:hypothetical protein
MDELEVLTGFTKKQFKLDSALTIPFEGAA